MLHSNTVMLTCPISCLLNLCKHLHGKTIMQETHTRTQIIITVSSLQTPSSTNTPSHNTFTWHYRRTAGKLDAIEQLHTYSTLLVCVCVIAKHDILPPFILCCFSKTSFYQWPVKWQILWGMENVLFCISVLFMLFSLCTSCFSYLDCPCLLFNLFILFL